jgi:hypothetical protein
MTPQQEFWKWFGEHEDELIDLEADRERIFDRLSTQLKRIDPDLTFEFGPRREEREFVVSAGGIKRAFPAVTALVAAAPKLQHWRFTAFRPRRTPLNIVEFRGKRIHPEHVQFSLLDDGSTAGVHLFIPGYRDGDADFKQIGYLMLDEALGEYDVECKLGLVEMMPPESPTDGDRRPLSELPRRFDELVAQLGKRLPQ